MKFLKILKEYNQAIIKENQRLKRVYATLVRESEEDNENLDGEEQEFIEPPAPPAGDEDDEDTSTGNGEDDEDTSSGNGEDDEDTSAGNDEEGSQENESDDDIMQSGDEFFGEVNEGIGGALGAVGGAVLGANAADWLGAGQGSEEYQAAAADADKLASQASAAKEVAKIGGDVEAANLGINTTGLDPKGKAWGDYAKELGDKATKAADALKGHAGAPSEVGKFFKDNKWAGAAAGAAGGYAVGSAFDKDDKKNVAETEQPTMTAEEFFGESDSDGWQTPKEFYGEAEEEQPMTAEEFFREGEDHGALTERSAEPGEELMSAEEFLAGDDESLEEGLGSAVGAIGGAALGAYGAPHLKDALPTGTSSEVADAIANPATGAALGAGGGYLAGKAFDRDETDESEDDELMLAEDFFSDDAEDDGEMIPESDFFAEAAAMKV